MSMLRPIHMQIQRAPNKKKKKKETKQTPKKSDSDGFQIVICVTIFPGGQEVETSISKRCAFSYPVYDWFIIFVWKPHVGFTYNNNLTSCCKASLTLHSGCIENKMKRAFLRTFVPLIGLLPTLHDMVVLKVLFKNNNNCFAFSFFLISRGPGVVANCKNGSVLAYGSTWVLYGDEVVDDRWWLVVGGR